MRLVSTAAAVLVVGLAACGNSDKDDAEQLVRDVAEATAAKDGDKLCGELLSPQFLQQVTQAKGDRARRVCESRVRRLRRGGYRLVKITKTDVDGDRATVRAVVEAQGRRTAQVFPLKKEGGKYRLEAAAR